ncbi:MAG TPA: FAD:protein FMN transferase [Kiloniellales bacterium]|nr:FAD:protein FMN transferase [Kiloniellales bacterium]
MTDAIEEPDITRGLSRRRVLTVMAALAGLPLLNSAGTVRGAAAPRFAWRGIALGARAELVVAHPDAAAARRAARFCLDEVMRLERAFSLFRPDSELSRLNRRGTLASPSLDLRVLLAEAQRFGALTAGAFDPTVQPLWQLHVRHFAKSGADRSGPAGRDLEAALALVDYRALDVAPQRIILGRPGMALTLNGIAQGYITDRVADLLRDLGFDRVLVELGEIRALDAPPDASAWHIGLADPEVPGRPLSHLALHDRAAATSSGLAARFDPTAHYNHLFDPATGASPRGWRSVTVVAKRATTADALSTALAVVPPHAAARLLQTGGGDYALVLTRDLRLRRIAP